MPFLGLDHQEQLASFDEGQKARHRAIVLRLVSVGWNEAAASFLAIDRVMEEDAVGRLEASKSIADPLTDAATIVNKDTVITTNTDVANSTPAER